MNAKQVVHRLRDLKYSVREDAENGTVTVKVICESGKVIGGLFSVEELCLQMNPVLAVVRKMNQMIIDKA